MPHTHQHYLKMKRRKTRAGLDNAAVEEYTRGGMTFTRFRSPETTVFRPSRFKYYGCQLATVTIPMGMKRIPITSIYSSEAGSDYGARLAAATDPVRPVFLTVIYRAEQSGTFFHPEPDSLVQACDYCENQRQEEDFLGIETPCARSLTGGSSLADHLFVEWNWAAAYPPTEGPTSVSDDLVKTGQALNDIFKSSEPVKLVGMVTPNHTVIWVPFSTEQGHPEAKPFTNEPTVNLPDVVYMDKPGIWLERRLRFTL